MVTSISVSAGYSSFGQVRYKPYSGDEEFAGHEQTLFRVIGMTVMVIGWLYLFGGRSGGRQTVAASILDRWILVPLVLVPIAMTGIFPHVFLAFALLDASLALGAWMLRAKT